MSLVQEAHNAIQVEPIGSKLDELPGPLRDIVSQPDEWHIVNNKLFRVVDEITQVVERKHWGSDKDDADADPLATPDTTSRLFLEELGLVYPEATSTEITDILGSAAAADGGYQVYDTSQGTRVDVDPSHISIVPGGAFFDEDVEAGYSGHDHNEIVMQRGLKTFTANMPDLPDEAYAKLAEIKDEYDALIARVKDDKELELLYVMFEQALDRVINPYLTLALNSPYCGRGYSAPQREHIFINTPQVFPASEAADERERFFYQLIGEAGSCSNWNDLFGPRLTTRTVGPDGNDLISTTRPGGFFGKVRGMYAHDKELSNKWGLVDRYDKDGNLVQESAFTKERKQFIRQYREQNKGDEEALRIAVWVWFDRIAGEIPAVYDGDELVQPRRRFRDSIWRQRRTKALQDLFLKRRHWDAIYDMLGVVKQRLQLSKNPTEERRDTLKKLAKYFRKVQSLSDLKRYMAWAQKRRVTRTREAVDCSQCRQRRLFRLQSGNRTELCMAAAGPDGWQMPLDILLSRKDLKCARKNRGGKCKNYQPFQRAQDCTVIPSLLDRVSVNDEYLWKKSCTKKERYLLGRLQLFAALHEQVKSNEPTDLEDISITCPYLTKERHQDGREYTVPCDCMATGQPEFFELDNNRGLLGIRCDGCNKIVWLLHHKESPELLTKSELAGRFHVEGEDGWTLELSLPKDGE
jgi:hypothetical protein